MSFETETPAYAKPNPLEFHTPGSTNGHGTPTDLLSQLLSPIEGTRWILSAGTSRYRGGSGSKSEIEKYNPVYDDGIATPLGS